MSTRIGIMLRAVAERGGVGVYTANLTEHLLRIGSDHEWVLFYRSASDMGRYASLPNVREVLVRGRAKPLWDQVQVPLAARRNGVDVLFHPKFTVPLVAPCPTVMTLHGTGWFTTAFFGRLDVAYLRVFLPMYLRRAAAVSSVSQLTTDFYNHRYQMSPGKIRTIYFGPADNFGPVQDLNALERVRAQYRLPQRYVLNLTKHRDAERKNIRGVLAAFREIAPRVDHHLVIGGTGCEQFREEYEVPSDDWGARVHFPGWIDQQHLPAVYAMASAFLYPSFMEAFPIPITEALKCEIPIVTSNRNGLAELAGDAAVQVDPDNPMEIARAIEQVLGDPALRATLAAAARERSKLFSWERCAAVTLQLLVDTARAHGRPSDRPPESVAR